MELYNHEDIYNKYLLDRTFGLEYLKLLFKTFNNKFKYDTIKYYGDILALIYSFILLPTKLNINKSYINNNNEYTFIDPPIDTNIDTNNYDNILTTDRIIYIDNTIPVPFTFPLIKENKVELILSNIYYYELTILDKNNENINSNYISIGFKNNDYNVYYNSDGIIQKNITIRKFEPWIIGDTVGAGIIYIKKNFIKYFFTNNGKIIYMGNQIYIKHIHKVIPIINYKHSHTIKLNFSDEIFAYDIKELLNSSLVLSTNNMFLKTYNSELFTNNNNFR